MRGRKGSTCSRPQQWQLTLFDGYKNVAWMVALWFARKVFYINITLDLFRFMERPPNVCLTSATWEPMENVTLSIHHFTHSTSVQKNTANYGHCVKSAMQPQENVTFYLLKHLGDHCDAQ